MQTLPGISTMQMTLIENQIASSDRDAFRYTVRKAKKTDWDLVLAKTDLYVSRAGAVVLALAVLYFIPIFVSILTR